MLTIECKEKDLQDALLFTTQIIPQKTKILQLKSLSLKTEENSLSLLASDLDHVTEYTIPAKVSEAGKEIVLPPHEFKRIIDFCKAEDITLQVDKFLKIIDDSATFNLTTFSNFPIEIPPDKDSHFLFSLNNLGETIKRVITATGAMENNLPFFFEISDSQLHIYSYSSSIFALKSYPIEHKIPDNIPFVYTLPSKSANFLSCFETCDVFGSSSLVTIKDAIKYLKIRTMNQKPPDWKKSFKFEYDIEDIFNLDLFIETIQKASIFNYFVSLSWKNSSLIVSAESDLGNFSQRLPASVKEEYQAKFDATLLLNCLKSLKGEIVHVKLNDRLVHLSTPEPDYWVMLAQMVGGRS